MEMHPLRCFHVSKVQKSLCCISWHQYTANPSAYTWNCRLRINLLLLSTWRDELVEARYFLQQLISGINYCHSLQICHRDLKLENTLLDGRPAPRLKICDFGYSKSSLLHSRPKSTVGTPAYIAPEVLSRREYDGKMAAVWSCGVTLYVMLVGAYPFEDQEDPKNFRKTISDAPQLDQQGDPFSAAKAKNAKATELMGVKPRRKKASWTAVRECPVQVSGPNTETTGGMKLPPFLRDA